MKINIKKQRGFFGIAALVLGGIGLYQGYQAQQSAKEAASQQAAAQQEQAAAQRESIRIQQKSADVQTQQARIRQLREARIARARVLSSAANMGIGTASTGVSGAISSISSQAGANIGAINVQQSFSEAASVQNERASTAASTAAVWGAKSQGYMATAAQWQGLAQLGFQAGGQLGAWESLLSPNITQAAASTPARTATTSEFLSGPQQIRLG